MKLQTFCKPVLLLACFLSLVSSASKVMGQSTIFNVPSTDVQAPRKVYFEADFITHFASYANGGYQTYGPRVVVGLPGNSEVGVNVFYTRSADPEPINVQPNFKWQFYNNGKRGVTLAAGGLVSIPMTHRRGNGTTGMLYVVGRKAYQGSYGPKFTLGGYRLVGPFDAGADRTGLLAGYEQPVTKTLAFVSDWFSGNNEAGSLTTGAAITLSPKQILYAGYSFGDQGRGNNSLDVYYGYTF